MAEEDDDEKQPFFEDDEQESGMFRWMSALVVLLAVAGFFGLAWYAYKSGGEAVDEKDVELVKADKTPVKEAPANPGGMQIPNQDKTVYSLISGKTEKPVVERILPAPEEPLPRGDTETWMSDSVKNKTGGEVEAMKGIPSAEAPSAGAASDEDSAAPATPKEQFNPAKARAASPAPVQVADATPPKPAAPAIQQPAQPPAQAPAQQPGAVAPAATKKPPEAAASHDSDDSDDSNDTEEEKPEAKAVTSPSPPSGTRVQLGAYRSQSEAESHWRKISGKFAGDVRSKQYYVVKADLGKKGVYYRLQLAPFGSSSEAEEFCLDFVSAGQGCILAKGK